MALGDQRRGAAGDKLSGVNDGDRIVLIERGVNQGAIGGYCETGAKQIRDSRDSEGAEHGEIRRGAVKIKGLHHTLRVIGIQALRDGMESVERKRLQAG